MMESDRPHRPSDVCQANSKYGSCSNKVTGRNVLCLKCQKAAIVYVAQLEKKIERLTDCQEST